MMTMMTIIIGSIRSMSQSAHCDMISIGKQLDHINNHQCSFTHLVSFLLFPILPKKLSSCIPLSHHYTITIVPFSNDFGQVCLILVFFILLILLFILIVQKFISNFIQLCKTAFDRGSFCWLASVYSIVFCNDAAFIDFE